MLMKRFYVPMLILCSSFVMLCSDKSTGTIGMAQVDSEVQAFAQFIATQCCSSGDKPCPTVVSERVAGYMVRNFNTYAQDRVLALTAENTRLQQENAELQQSLQSRKRGASSALENLAGDVDSQDASSTKP